MYYRMGAAGDRYRIGFAFVLRDSAIGTSSMALAA